MKKLVVKSVETSMEKIGTKIVLVLDLDLDLDLVLVLILVLDNIKKGTIVKHHLDFKCKLTFTFKV